MEICLFDVFIWSYGSMIVVLVGVLVGYDINIEDIVKGVRNIFKF